LRLKVPDRGRREACHAVQIAVFLILGFLACLAAGAPAQAQATAYQVLGMTSTTSASDAANMLTNKIQPWLKDGWAPVNISSADMFPFVLDSSEGDSGSPVYSVQGTKQWDIYVLLSCSPKFSTAKTPVPKNTLLFCTKPPTPGGP